MKDLDHIIWVKFTLIGYFFTLKKAHVTKVLFGKLLKKTSQAFY
jgi:hypothetical protein